MNFLSLRKLFGAAEPRQVAQPVQQQQSSAKPQLSRVWPKYESPTEKIASFDLNCSNAVPQIFPRMKDYPFEADPEDSLAP